MHMEQYVSVARMLEHQVGFSNNCVFLYDFFQVLNFQEDILGLY